MKYRLYFIIPPSLFRGMTDAEGPRRFDVEQKAVVNKSTHARPASVLSCKHLAQRAQTKDPFPAQGGGPSLTCGWHEPCYSNKHDSSRPANEHLSY
jgi:hypothetical protein